MLITFVTMTLSTYEPGDMHDDCRCECCGIDYAVPHRGTATDRTCRGCGETAHPCRGCGSAVVLSEDEVECAECRERAGQALRLVDAITAALRLGAVVRIAPASHGRAGGVTVGDVEIVFASNLHWVDAAMLAAPARRAG